MTSTSRTTRNSQKTGIGEALVAMAPESTSSRGPSVPIPLSSLTPAPPSDNVPEIKLPSEGDDGDDIYVNDDPDNADHNSDQNDEPDPQQEYNLARSLELLAKKISRLPKPEKPKNSVKPRVPDTFDGTDPHKLETFTFQCSMYLAARSGDFPDEESRVTFVLSYLKGTPLDWFQTEVGQGITDGGLPDWFSNYPAFIKELQRHFGPRDPVTDAMNALESLRYKDSTKATRYAIDFNRHSRRTGWNEQALSRHYYKGLPERRDRSCR